MIMIDFVKRKWNFDVMRRRLIEWGRQNFRNFPWRFTTDPYFILISEILLHRTRAEQVVPFYLELIKRYPTVVTLANAKLSDLKMLLYPLGLRWRVEKMHLMAKEIVKRYSGKIPYEKKKLLALPGISQYIAGAVLCFAYGKPEPLLDTNTVRVIGRLFGLSVTDSSRRSKKFEKLMYAFLDKDNPREFNYALLDLAAIICLKKTLPRCSICPLKEFCKYFIEEKEHT